MSIYQKTAKEIADELIQKLEKVTVDEYNETNLTNDIIEIIENERVNTNNWYDFSGKMYNNMIFYRELLVEIGEIIGKESYICDDGTISQDVLILKLPELAKKYLNKKNIPIVYI